ncbi:hypothetical protein ACTXT7_004364 [Hymenolepis weldensis]
MESRKFTPMDSLHFTSRKYEPLSSLRSFYAANINEQSQTSEDAEHSLIWTAASPGDLPSEAVMQIMTSQLLDRKVVASMTGPDSGFQVAREWKGESTSKTLVCGTHVFVDNWKEIPHPRVFGKSISLYDTNPVTGRTSGDPIADAFVVKVRPNSAFMAVADGVNWGEAPMRAARCAINAVYEHLETNFLLGGPEALKIRNTRKYAIFKRLKYRKSNAYDKMGVPDFSFFMALKEGGIAFKANSTRINNKFTIYKDAIKIQLSEIQEYKVTDRVF